MKPAAGVIVARPAMAPTQSPTKPGRPRRTQSMSSHRNRATEAEISEFTAAPTATEPVDSADPQLQKTNAKKPTALQTASSVRAAGPALNPNQPNHNMAVPNATKGTL